MVKKLSMNLAKKCFIELNDIRIFAHHGCLAEETLIGADYRVELKVECSVDNALISDDLNDTVDYVELLSIIKAEMKIPSKLLEHVAERIMKRLLNIDKISHVNLKICKQNPPINGNVKEVCFVYQQGKS